MCTYDRMLDASAVAIGAYAHTHTHTHTHTHSRVQMLNYQQLREDAMGDGTTSCILCGLDFTSQRSRKQIPINFCQECGNVNSTACKFNTIMM